MSLRPYTLCDSWRATRSATSHLLGGWTICRCTLALLYVGQADHLLAGLARTASHEYMRTQHRDGSAMRFNCIKLACTSLGVDNIER